MVKVDDLLPSALEVFTACMRLSLVGQCTGSTEMVNDEMHERDHRHW
jgi:hypothetical protein